jgi:hypothetical protein
MATITMNMGSYEIERDAAPEYGEEVLCAGWVPTLALREREAEHIGMPHPMADIDVDTFLRTMYAQQR